MNILYARKDFDDIVYSKVLKIYSFINLGTEMYDIIIAAEPLELHLYVLPEVHLDSLTFNYNIERLHINVYDYTLESMTKFLKRLPESVKFLHMNSTEMEFYLVRGVALKNQRKCR